MPRQTKLTIVSVAAGAGHVRTAQVLKKTADLRFPDLDVEHIDLGDFVNSSARKAFIDSYNLIVTQAPDLWGVFYRQTNRPKMKKVMDRLATLLNRMNSKKLAEHLAERRPDYVLSTHFLPAALLASMRSGDGFRARLGFLLTDYDIHELLVGYQEQDYFTPTEMMEWKIERRGVPADRVFATGIPLDPVFYEDKDRVALERKHGVDPARKTVLVLAGGYGLVRQDKMVKTLFGSAAPLNVIAVAGRNKALERSVRELVPPAHVKVTVVGWTDAMDELMRVADIVVTKPGGVTTTECLTLGKPIVMFDAIPGQEEHNVDFVLAEGWGRKAVSHEDLLYYVERGFETPAGVWCGKRKSAEIILDRIGSSRSVGPVDRG